MERILEEITKTASSFGKTPVFGRGSVCGGICLLGEAPGAREEATGMPFAGSAGKYLDEFLLVLGLTREEIYITNTVKIRPVRRSEKTGRFVNRPPRREEIEAFAPILKRELEIMGPKIVVTLGNTALRGVCGPSAAIGALHGRLIAGGAFDIFPLYHPAAVIYRRGLRDEYIGDLEALKPVIDEIKEKNKGRGFI